MIETCYLVCNIPKESTIAVALKNRLCSTTGRHWRAVTFVLAAALLTTSCTNSKLIISPLYNRLDNTLRSQFTDLGEFDDAQLARADILIGNFHVWHRQNELPAYAGLLDEVRTTAGRSGMPDAVDAATIRRWFGEVETLANRVRRCHPINFSADLIGSMSDDQISAMYRSILKERAEDRAEHGDRSAEERRERRAGRFIKWAGRIGVTLNESQKALLEDTLARQVSLREQYSAASDVWLQGLFALFDERRDDDFEPRLQQHLQGLGQWLQQDYPDQWQKNRALWSDFALEFLNSLTPAQRRAADRWMSKMANTLRAVAADEPSFKATGKAAEGCQSGDERVTEGV